MALIGGRRYKSVVNISAMNLRRFFKAWINGFIAVFAMEK